MVKMTEDEIYDISEKHIKYLFFISYLRDN